MALRVCRGCPTLERVTKKEGESCFQFQHQPVESLRAQQNDFSPLTVIFVQADKVRSCATCRSCFTDVLRIPEVWWSPWCRRSNGYFGCEATDGDHGEINGYNTWFRFLIKRTLLNKAQVGRDLDYEWLKLNIFTRWDSSTKGTVVIMFDTRPDIKARLLSLLFDAINPIRLGDPYFHHVLIAEEVLNLQNEAAWSIRDSVRHVELARTAFPDFPRLHDLARHAIHVVETLDLAARTLDSMIMHHDRFASATIATYGTIQTTQHLINDRLHFYKEAIHGLRLRSISNKDRLLNEIQFSFNVATQNIASATMKINQAVQSDSSAMKTVALLTAVFIPLTYIATLFSMSFFGFNTDSGKWHISNKFWMYWAVSIPFTSAAAIFMYLYHWMFTSQKSNSY